MLVRFRLFCCASLSCSLTLIPPNPAQALLLPGYETGAGDSTSLFIVDFGFNGGDAYLFTYRHDGDATSQDMLLALDAAGDLTVHHQFFEFEVDGELVRSIFIDGFSYDGNSAVPVFEGENGENWSFWTVDERVAAPGFWTPAPVGATDRVISDGSWEGWMLNVSAFNTKGLSPTSNPPVVPIAGDTDGDGDVDDADLGTMFSQYSGAVGLAGGKGFLDGDTDIDGDIDDADLGSAFANYTGARAAAPVPEPAGGALILSGGLMLNRRRRNR